MKSFLHEQLRVRGLAQHEKNDSNHEMKFKIFQHRGHGGAQGNRELLRLSQWAAPSFGRG